jgi:hypothetical protein
MSKIFPETTFVIELLHGRNFLYMTKIWGGGIQNGHYHQTGYGKYFKILKFLSIHKPFESTLD